MTSEFPYQLVAFLGAEPTIGEPVYYGDSGWYPQIALKRRFKVTGLSEPELFSSIQAFCDTVQPFVIQTGELAQPERMPVKAISVDATPELTNFHQQFIAVMGEQMISRFPERDGTSYLPHITVEHAGNTMVDVEQYSHCAFKIAAIYILKDVTDMNSVAYARFTLGS